MNAPLKTYPGIVTEQRRPPVPTRKWDWLAYREGYEHGDPIGEGEDESSAIADLICEESSSERP